MTHRFHRANWQLPPGVSRGTWDYVQSPRIADQYDAFLQDIPLMQLDVDVTRQLAEGKLEALPMPALLQGSVIADLGCGTGRLARALAGHGYKILNLDLSQSMLQALIDSLPARDESSQSASCVPDTPASDGLPTQAGDCGSSSSRIAVCRANLAELQLLAPNSIDLAACLFSSLGMLRGREHRVAFLSSVRDSLSEQGRVIVHVHNRYRELLTPAGFSWLFRNWLASCFSKTCEYGDRVYAYRGLPAMYLHIYSRQELIRDFTQAGFSRTSLLPISTEGDRLLTPLRASKTFTAGGYFAIAKK